MGMADLCRGQRRSPPAVSGREVPVPLAASSSAGIPAASLGLFWWITSFRLAARFSGGLVHSERVRTGVQPKRRFTERTPVASREAVL